MQHWIQSLVGPRRAWLKAVRLLVCSGFRGFKLCTLPSYMLLFRHLANGLRLLSLHITSALMLPSCRFLL